MDVVGRERRGGQVEGICGDVYLGREDNTCVNRAGLVIAQCFVLSGVSYRSNLAFDGIKNKDGLTWSKNLACVEGNAVFMASNRQNATKGKIFLA